jgi:hypothetical protein
VSCIGPQILPARPCGFPSENIKLWRIRLHVYQIGAEAPDAVGLHAVTSSSQPDHWKPYCNLVCTCMHATCWSAGQGQAGEWSSRTRSACRQHETPVILIADSASWLSYTDGDLAWAFSSREATHQDHRVALLLRSNLHRIGSWFLMLNLSIIELNNRSR